MNITVNAVYMITASPVGDKELTSQPCQSVYFQFEVTNLGNTEDIVVIDYAGSLSPNAGDFGWVNQTFSISSPSVI